jgi:hypothetical protein
LSGPVNAIPPVAARSRWIGTCGAAKAAKIGRATPAADLSSGGVLVERGRTRRPEMAPQPVEMSRFAPGNGMAPADHTHREQSDAIQWIVGRRRVSRIAAPPKPVERQTSFDALSRLAMTRPPYRNNGRAAKLQFLAPKTLKSHAREQIRAIIYLT